MCRERVEKPEDLGPTVSYAFANRLDLVDVVVPPKSISCDGGRQLLDE
jgi:hypothetical protein